MYSNTILKLDLIIIIIQKYCFKYLKPDKNIDKIKKSKTIQFVLDQLNDIRKTKDFKTLKSIFTIEKKHKIKDLKDWLNILCVNNFKLFSKHFKLDVEIDMTKGYRTYVNLLSKLENNKTKVDLKESNKKISILFNLLFCNIIVGGERKPKTKAKRYVTPRQRRLAKYVSQNSTSSPNSKDTKNKSRLYNTAKFIMTTNSIIRNFQDAPKHFMTSIISASKSKPSTLFKIVALMKAALKATNLAELSKNITCPPQQENLGTCWIISVIAALVYSSNFGKILEYICSREILELPDDVLQGDGTIKTIILSNFSLLFALLTNDVIRTPIGKNAYTMPNNFIKNFVEQIFNKDPSFFKRTRSDASQNPTSLPELLTMGGDYYDRQHLITNILEKGFGFTTTIEDVNTRVYNYKLKEQTQDYSFTLLHIPYRAYTSLDSSLRKKYKLASYKLASYIVVAAHESVRHSVAVVKINGENVHCNGWCDPNVGCMIQEIDDSGKFSLTTGKSRFEFNIDHEHTLVLAYDNWDFVDIPTIQQNFAPQLELGQAQIELIQGLGIKVESESVSSLSSLEDSEDY